MDEPVSVRKMALYSCKTLTNKGAARRAYYLGIKYSTPRAKTDKLEKLVNRELNVTRS